MLTLSLIECLRNTVQTVIHDSFTTFDKVCVRVLLDRKFSLKQSLCNEAHSHLVDPPEDAPGAYPARP